METAFEKLSGRSGLLKSPEELETLIDKTIQAAQTYVEGIATGDFRLTSADLTATSCQYCQYGAACRVSEAKEFGVLS
jgi:ATP-dependent helicase/DNAse subunit B